MHRIVAAIVCDRRFVDRALLVFRTLRLSRNVSVFTADDGGLRSRTDTNRPGTKIYFMGIIDILQQYNTKKALEHAVKGIKYDPVSEEHGS